MKTPHTKIEIEGEIPNELLRVLKKLYPKRLELSFDNEQMTDIKNTSWYRKNQKNRTPGKALRVYRERDGLTQKQLAEKLNVYVQHISNMENNKRAISKEMAKKLAEIFETSVDRFI